MMMYFSLLSVTFMGFSLLWPNKTRFNNINLLKIRADHKLSLDKVVAIKHGISSKKTILTVFYSAIDILYKMVSGQSMSYLRLSLPKQFVKVI